MLFVRGAKYYYCFDRFNYLKMGKLFGVRRFGKKVASGLDVVRGS